ncbi:MAG TPA: diguanylate cyclase [Polyangiales bacterium]
MNDVMLLKESFEPRTSGSYIRYREPRSGATWVHLAASWLEHRQHRAVAAIASICIALIAAVDSQVGRTFPLFLFYLLPVGVGAWFASRRVGLWLSVWSASLCVAVELMSWPAIRPVSVAWNAGTRFALLAVATLLLCTLRDQLAREHKLAHTDSLTELLNRRAFGSLLEREAERARRYAHPISVLYLDLDDFKVVNDSQGHGEGDRVLCEVARLLLASCRASDGVARIGGDEFAVLCPEADEYAAAAVARKVHTGISQLLESGSQLTISIGVTTFLDVPNDLRQLLRRADSSMYLAKRGGKNRVHHTVVARGSESTSSRGEGLSSAG